MIDDTNNENVQNETTEQPAQQPAAPVGLSVTDLVNVKRIIDVASSRGAFQPNEMTVVGVTYDRLVAFLQSIAPAQPAEASAETTVTEETTEG